MATEAALRYDDTAVAQQNAEGGQEEMEVCDAETSCRPFLQCSMLCESS